MLVGFICECMFSRIVRMRTRTGTAELHVETPSCHDNIEGGFRSIERCLYW